MSDTLLELNCLIHGDGSLDIFLVKILASETVSILRDVIKDKNQQTFRQVDANNLQLFKVSIPIDSELDGTLAKFKPHNPDNNVHELSPVDDLSQIFSDHPVRKHLHIIVQPVPLGASRHSFNTIAI
jgi:Crinkler effector protein N-terminal domain